MNAYKLAIKDTNDIAEFKGQIVDIFEDYLADKGVVLKHEDIDLAIEDGEAPEEMAIIYGGLYDIIGDAAENVINDCLENNENDGYGRPNENGIKEIWDAFIRTIETGKSDFKPSLFDETELRSKVRKTFSNWKVKWDDEAAPKLEMYLVKYSYNNIEETYPFFIKETRFFAADKGELEEQLQGLRNTFHENYPEKDYPSAYFKLLEVYKFDKETVNYSTRFSDDI